jgi:hypothetical protein
MDRRIAAPHHTLKIGPNMKAARDARLDRVTLSQDLRAPLACHSLQGDHLPEEFLPRLGGATDESRAWGHVRYHTGLRPDPGPFTDPHMPSHRRLTADLDKVLQHGGTRDAHLRHDDTASAEPDIVPDLHQVIEPGTRTDHCISRRASINGGVGADLHVVLKDHPP